MKDYLPSNKFTSIEKALKAPKKALHLEIKRGKGLKDWWPKLKELVHLEELHITITYLSSLPTELKYLKQLRVLSLSRNGDLRMLPEALGALENLEELHLGTNFAYNLPSSLGQLPKLHTITTKKVDISADLLPNKLGKSKSLRVLKLKGTEFEELPKFFSQLRQLEHLEFGLSFQYPEINSIPDDYFKKLTRLETLTIHSSALTTLPQSLFKLPNLSEFALLGSLLDSFPKALLKLPKLKKITLRGSKIPNEGEFQGVWQYCTKNNISESERDVYFDILEIKEDRTYPKQILYNALCLAEISKPLASNALHFISKQAQCADSSQLLKKGDKLALLAKTKFPKRVLKKHFKANGIQLIDKVNSLAHPLETKVVKEASHLLLGIGNNQLADISQYELISPQNLLDFLDILEEKYLLTEDEDTKEMQDNVEALLQSVNPESVLLGLEMMKTGGVPKSKITELFFLALNENKDIQKKAKELLKPVVSPITKKLLRKRTTTAHLARLNENDMIRDLRTWTKGTELDMDELALRFYDKQLFVEKISTYIFEEGREASRKKILDTFYKEACLDLTGLKFPYLDSSQFPHWAEDMKAYNQTKVLILSDNYLSHFPEAFTQFRDLERLEFIHNFYLSSLGESHLERIRSFPKLKDLTLSYDKKFSKIKSLFDLPLERLHLNYGGNWETLGVFPEEILQLKQLKTLKFSGRTDLPKKGEILAELSQLKKLDLSDIKGLRLRRWIGELEQLEEIDLRGSGFSTLPTICKKLPNCKVLF